MSQMDNQQWQPFPITASTVIKRTGGVIGRIFVASATTGTIAVYNGTSAAAPKLIDTTTVLGAASYTFDMICSSGIYVETTGTISATVLYI